MREVKNSMNRTKTFIENVQVLDKDIIRQFNLKTKK